MKIVRWFLVIPGSILFFGAADFIVPLILNVIIFIGSIIKLSPILDVVLSPKYGGDHFVVFTSYLLAIYGGSRIAPSRKKTISIVLASLFLLLRISMTYSVFIDSHFTEDSPTKFIIGTIAAILGVILGVYLITRYADCIPRTETKLSKANPELS